MTTTTKLLDRVIAHLSNLVIPGSDVGLTISEHYGNPVLLVEVQVEQLEAVYCCEIALDKDRAWQQYHDEILSDLFQEEALNFDSEMMEALTELGARNLIVQLAEDEGGMGFEGEIDDYLGMVSVSELGK